MLDWCCYGCCCPLRLFWIFICIFCFELINLAFCVQWLLFMRLYGRYIDRQSTLNEFNSTSAVDLLVMVFFSLRLFESLRASEESRIFTIWKFSPTRSTTNVVQARVHNSLRIHPNLHNNPKRSAMSFCSFNYYCLNNFLLLASARATYGWLLLLLLSLSLFSLQIVGRLCICMVCVCVHCTVFLVYLNTDNVTTHMDGERRLMAVKLNQMPVFFYYPHRHCLFARNQPVCMNESQNQKEKCEREAGRLEKKHPLRCIYYISCLGWFSLHIVMRFSSYFSSNFMTWRSGHLLHGIAIAIYTVCIFPTVIFRISFFNMIAHGQQPEHYDMIWLDALLFVFFCEFTIFRLLLYAFASKRNQHSNVQIPQFTFCSISFNGSSSFLMYEPLSYFERLTHTHTHNDREEK